MDPVDFQTGWVDPGWLTHALRKKAKLRRGRVVDVDAEAASAPAVVSRLLQLELTYSAEVEAAAPRSLFMKLNEGPFFEMGAKELSFYGLEPPAGGPLPLAGFVAGFADEQARRAAVILEDLSRTHRGPSVPWPGPAPLEEHEAAISALAEVHARFAGACSGQAAFAEGRGWEQSWLRRAAAAVDGFFAALGEARTPKGEATYARVLARLEAGLVARTAKVASTTVMHGDAHVWNFLFSEAGPGAVALDWQLWRVGPGAFDLAYMLALHGEPEWRAAHERDLVEGYAARLGALGAPRPWSELWTDYRIGVAFALLYPVLLCAKGVSPSIWRPHVRRGLAAFEDLACAELL